VLLASALPLHAATYKEAAGRVVIEAEHFDKRTTNTTGLHHWAIMPDENGKPDTAADPGFANARGGKYMQSLPDTAGGGQNNNTVAQVGTDPYMEFKVQISNPGTYRLWMRWGGYDGSSDSIYAQIMELKAPTGPGPDWYRYIGNINGDFNGSWNGSGAPSTDSANNVGGGGGEVPAVWTIAAPGTYTIRVSMREDGSTVDALMLQFASYAAPGDPGPAESDTTTATDTTPPTISSALTYGNPNGVSVIFSEAVSPATATNKSNYAINNGVTVNSASMGPNNFTVLLNTTPIAPGNLYQVTVNGVQDTAAAPNTIAANSKAQFLQIDGVIEHRVFLNISGSDVASLTNSAAFTNHRPDLVTYEPQLEGPVNWGSTYGTQFRGYVTAPASGNYVFFICSDDNSSLYLSTDENPANKKLIAIETVRSNSRQWVSSGGNSDLTAKRSDQYTGTAWPTGNTITLVANKRYYIEVLHKQGGGGDNIAVTWELPGAGEPLDGDPPIPGAYLSAFGITEGPVTIASPPTTVTALEPGAATFTVGASGSPPFTYQWFRNGTNIAGATSSTYTLPIARQADSGSKFKVQVSNPFSTATSSEATLNVTPDTTPPLPLQITSLNGGFNVITLTFNELMDNASAQTPQNYVFTPGNIAATNVVLDATTTNVTITTATALTPGTNTLTLTGVKDLSGNTIASGTSIQFVFKSVTYAADILFDGPIGYYRFEETSGSVATNSGSTGGDGEYYTGDEASTGAGGTPSSASGVPGPRPPSFAGFDANNRAANFGGPNSQDWVDTKNQFLQGLSAFSLEYWVRPTNRVADATSFGTRIGIVGQNDAIEYGFIDANNIQIWTPNGGSLNTAYSFPDNEWHHVATIADGTTLKTYYDGTLVGSGGSAVADPATGYGMSAFNVHIGGGGVFDPGGNYFTGQIDEVAIFDKAIPAVRIAAHYLAGKQGGVLVTSGAVTPGPGGGKNIRLSATRSAGNLTISWSPAGGTLQSATALTGNPSDWKDAGTTNPTTVTIGTGNNFYRVKGP
jgi:Concanavalin A-like lectin/glucanases superfamily/PA14 domain